MAKRALLAVVSLLALLLVGCQGGRSIVGTWDVQGTGFTHEVTYTADGKMTGTMDAMGNKLAYEGTYKVEGDKMTSTGTSYTVNGKPAPAQVKAMIDPLVLRTTTSTFTWVNNDEITMDMQGQKVTLKRKPSGGN